MQKVLFWGLLLVFSFSACHKNTDEITVEETLEDYIELPQLLVKVQNTAGAALPAAEVELEGKRYLTNAQGEISLQNVRIRPLGSAINSRVSGYFGGVQRVVANQSVLSITMSPHSTSFTFGAGSGWSGQVNNEPVRIQVPANAFETESGQTYTGEVRLYFERILRNDAYFDAVVPPAMALTESKDQRMHIAPFGVFMIDAEGASGQRLKLRSGQSLNLELMMASNFSTDAMESVSKLNNLNIWTPATQLGANDTGFMIEIDELSVMWSMVNQSMYPYGNFEIGNDLYIMGCGTLIEPDVYINAFSATIGPNNDPIWSLILFPTNLAIEQPIDIDLNWVETGKPPINCAIMGTPDAICPVEMTVTLLPTDSVTHLFGVVNGLLPDGRIVKGNFFILK
jgi:hypothetical protein